MLVLIHGAGCDSHAWDTMLGVLPGPSMAIDLPGRGSSPGAACATAEEAARFVLQAIAARGLRTSEAIVVGHSFGGGVAIECALQATLAGLVLLSTGARLRVNETVLALMRAQAAQSPRSRGAIGFRPTAAPELIAEFDAFASRVPVLTAMADWFAANAFDRIAALAHIDVPTLVISGEHDELTPPKYARFLAEQIRGAKLEFLSDAGHMCIVEDGVRVAALVRAFASQLGH